MNLLRSRMKEMLVRLSVMLIVLAGLAYPNAAAAQMNQSTDPIHVALETDAGLITLELYPGRAPVTVENFMRYVDGGYYDGATIYRVVRPGNDNGSPKIEVIQGGLGRSDTAPFPPIAHETTEATGLRHTDGTLSMARGDPGTAAAEFFITIGDQPSLDYGGTRNPDTQGFAAFGRVVDGMDVVRKIQQMSSAAPADDPYVAGQILEKPVVITKARRLDD